MSQKLEEAKRLYETANADQRYVLERLFPELKESEDERIRKALIEMVHDTTGDSLWVDYNVHKEDALAWLEKQKEQKSADKPESRFKVGDWVINTSGDVNQITKDYGDGFTLDNNVYLSDSWAAKHYRLWTIQDAKDGDVLSYRDGQWIFIYKEKIDDSSFCYHTLYSTIHQDLTINDAGFTLLGDAIIPAAKEQRDLLFQKMKEAGYGWDAVKKELKKIEQSPAWSEEDEERLQSCLNVLQARGIMEVTETVNTKWLKSLKDRVQPKQGWSEEDKMMIDLLIKIFEVNYPYAFYKMNPIGTINMQGIHTSEIVNWLKSLKDRCTWKPSDEQIEALKGVQEGVFRLGILKSLYQDLKKLKEE